MILKKEDLKVTLIVIALLSLWYICEGNFSLLSYFNSPMTRAVDLHAQASVSLPIVVLMEGVFALY